MCGLAGYSGSFEPSLLDAMASAIAHRGPDSAGLRAFHRGRTVGVGLAHRRLSILDLSSDGDQPMPLDCPCCGVHSSRAAEEGVWLAYNGEIYNFRELRAELEAEGHTFRSRTDSEVLLHLYAREGAAMLRRLNGIYALALYDGRPHGQVGEMRPGDVLLARDGLGVKPLYLAELPDGVVFASEIKALLQSRAVPRDLDPVALHYHLAYLWTPTPHTLLQGVRKLPPGNAALLRDGRTLRVWRHYDLPYDGERMRGSEAEIADRLRDEVERAVSRQMVADVEVGAFLSGGLDSSAVVAMMHRARPDYRPRCYTIAFKGAQMDGSPQDLPYARRVARHLDVDLQTLEVEPDVIGRLDELLYFLDEPQADPAPINALLIAERAREDGIKVLLSGAGGDDIFSGYRRHHALRMERMWGWMPRAMRAVAARPARVFLNGRGPGGLMSDPRLRRVAKAFAYADEPRDRRLASYFFWSGEATRRALYSADLSAALADTDTAEPLLNTLGQIPGETDPLNRMLYLEAKHFLADHNLNYTDKTAMAAGVEARVPLLDLELVRFATRIPPSMKQRGPVGKAIFKRAMKPLLPHDVIYRPKTGFGAPLRHWLHHELREMAEDTLSPRAIRERGLFDATAVQRLWEMDRQGRIDGAYTLFALMCVEIWCRQFVDAPVPRGPERPAMAVIDPMAR